MIKLEVWKSYKDRLGKTHKITSLSITAQHLGLRDPITYGFEADGNTQNHWYEDGRTTVEGEKDTDLIEEVSDNNNINTYGLAINYLKAVCEIKNYEEVIKMEMKDITSENLATAKAKFEVENSNAQVEYAKQQLRAATDKINEIEVKIKDLNDSRKPYDEIIAKFK